MKTLAHVLIAIQDIANDFGGSLSLKNAQGKYFYANESWLNIAQMSSEELMGKTDDELFPPEDAAFIRSKDQEALENGALIQYTNTFLIHGEELTYIALKWTVKHKTGEVFCYCTLGDLIEHKDRVLQMKPKIKELLDFKISESDLSTDCGN
jgi:PAS domain S-box-containing protein